ncbi:hypothetical protein V7S43_016465 [Phytophthora oleae]|uniref:Uncharacterized protein n=1 Tax=Phytophthora oleae TaxID=2107226 RepID=A0ABD3EW96_9STRA
MSLWLTKGLGGGYGYDWDQQVDWDNFLMTNSCKFSLTKSVMALGGNLFEEIKWLKDDDDLDALL